MCTVTYIPLNENDFILTSSRDVPFARKKSLLPKLYVEDGVELFYPRDAEAGGTWIGSSSKKRLICLLNGGFINHKPQPFYKKSRGLIVKKLLKKIKIEEALKRIDLIDVEPFTIVIVDWRKKFKLMEFVWDGAKKHVKKLAQEPHIWSSSTLYSDGMKEMRLNWFSDWLMKQSFNQKSILEFHHKAGIGNKKIDVLMKRENVGTVSITQVSKKDDYIKWNYEEIIPKE